jgi:MFS family permease
LGYRRKPWFFIGWFGFATFNLVLTAMGTPGINATIYISFVVICFLALSDVCTDTLCVERANLESDDRRGRLQSFGYIVSSSGRVLGAIAGTFLYDTGSSFSLSIAQIFLVNGLIPILAVIPVIWQLVEVSNSENIFSVTAQLQEAWKVLQLKAVWQPMIFLFTYSMLQVGDEWSIKVFPDFG